MEGDPKTKFLLFFLSAVHPSVRPKKTSPDFAPVRPTTSINSSKPFSMKEKSMSEFYFICNAGQLLGRTSEVRQGQGQGKFFLVGQRLLGRTADGRKFLFRFRTALFGRKVGVVCLAKFIPHCSNVFICLFYFEKGLSLS